MHSSFSLPSFRTKAPKRPFRCSGLRKLGMLLAPLVVFLSLADIVWQSKVVSTRISDLGEVQSDSGTGLAKM